MTSVRHYAVDDIEAGIVRLISDGGGRFEVPLAWLPHAVRVGDVLEVVAVSGDAGLVWLRPDRDEQRRRLSRRREVLERLQESDPGGDLTL